MKKTRKYVFGPVPSRRLGRSLGVDLVPYKTCTYDCVYCQLGFTNDKTITRQDYVPVDEVIKEVAEGLSEGVKPDYITLSGSGEPTLHSGIGSVIRKIKDLTDIPIAVLTNGSLLWLPQVRREISAADLVIPSLDAASPEIFSRINQPHSKIKFEQFVEGLIAFRKEYRGQIWLEIFLVKGINDTENEISGLVELAKKIKPDVIQLNTATRPPADPNIQAVKEEKLKEIALRFTPAAQVIAHFIPPKKDMERGCLDDIMSMCRRRPCTARDIADAFNLNMAEVTKYLGLLKSEGKIETKEANKKTYFFVKSNDSSA